MNSKLLILLLVLTCATLSAQSTHKENGWYNILNGQTDSIAEKPIVAVKDFEALRLDSFATDTGVCYISLLTLLSRTSRSSGVMQPRRR